MQLVEKEKYRSDIDGLRAIAVISVILFHLGYQPGGFLGVDVFFVISGYLITDILYREINNDSYSVVNFYIRRIRRILPLVSFICFISLVIGILVMLPDDLENLAQSVIATNFFGNNILQVLTTKNYWDVVNEFKPLMHTWSLAVEEQYYFLYPIIFSLFGKTKKHLILPIIIILTVISVILFLGPFQHFYKFYLLPFRFFEMSIGGIAAILLKGRLIQTKWSPVFILALITFLIVDFSFLPSWIPLMVCVLIACLVLSTSNRSSKISTLFLGNKIFKFIGKISFSLYMWHQVLFAFGRYVYFEEIGIQESIILVVLTLTLSIFTYYFIEQPFRNKAKFKTSTVVVSQIVLFIITTGISVFLYLNAGVVRDVPELEISTDNVQRSMHSAYNHKNYKLDKPFTDNSQKKKVLVIGDSFARDWLNVLIESQYSEGIELSYIFKYSSHDSLLSRAAQADYIFLAKRLTKEKVIKKLNAFKAKLWVVGSKNFGINNGLYYNYSEEYYCDQRVQMEKGYAENNDRLKESFNNRYLDVIGLVLDKKSNTVPVFTPNCKFISQDCRHFTKAGAKHFATLLPQLKNFPLKE